MTDENNAHSLESFNFFATKLDYILSFFNFLRRKAAVPWKEAGAKYPRLKEPPLNPSMYISCQIIIMYSEIQ